MRLTKVYICDFNHGALLVFNMRECEFEQLVLVNLFSQPILLHFNQLLFLRLSLSSQLSRTMTELCNIFFHSLHIILFFVEILLLVHSALTSSK